MIAAARASRWPAPLARVAALAPLALLALVGLGGTARAEAPVIVVDGRVAQYRMAGAAAKKGLPDAVEVSPTSDELAPALANASVIVAVGQQALSVAQRAAPQKPVVYCLVLGTPVARSTTVTGVPMEADPAVMFAHIKALSPGAKRVGLLYNAETGDAFAKEAKAAAAAAGISLVAAAVNGPGQVKTILSAKAAGIDALWLPPDPKLFNREIFTWILGFTAERKLPLFGFLDAYTEAGALASVSPDYQDIGLRAGKLAAEIAEKAAAQRAPVPAPVYSPGRFTLNLATAQALGIDVPQSAIARARKVYR